MADVLVLKYLSEFGRNINPKIMIIHLLKNRINISILYPTDQFLPFGAETV